MFIKPNNNKVTYNKIKMEDKGPPYDASRFAEIDLCLIKDKWNNYVVDVERNSKDDSPKQL